MVIISFVLIRVKRKQPLLIQKYFFPAFYLRIIGTMLISAITEYYYTYGDTYHFYYNAQALRGLFVKEPLTWLKVVFSDPLGGNESVTKYLDIIGNYSTYSAAVFRTAENASLSKIASIFNIICFDSYIGLALFFGLLSFLGCWYIFKTFVHIYPGYEKQFAWLCLYLPSLWFWGSGVLKDPMCLFALGILFHSFFVKYDSNLKRMILLCLGAFLLISIKSYIFYAFALAVVMGGGLSAFRRLRILGKSITIIIAAVIIVASYSLINNALTDILNDIIEDSQKFIELYAQNTESGDATIVPTLDPTPIGFLKFSTEGLITVFLKPFPWELRKPLYLFVALENLLIYYIIFKKVKTSKYEFKKNHLFLSNFCIAFFIVLGIIIGTNAFNLGTISRYRVPALPFLFAGVFSLKLANSKRKAGKMTKPQTYT